MKKSAHIKYIAGLILFGLNGIVSSKILLSSYEIVFFRTLFGSLFLIFLFSLKREKLQLLAYKKELVYVILSGVSMGLSWIFLYEAYQRIGVGLSSITYYTGPVIVMLSAPLVFHKKFSGRQWLYFALVLTGILFVSVPPLIGTTTFDLWGLFCGFASAVFHALMVIFTMKAPHITGLKNSMYQLTVSFLTICIFILAGHGIVLPATTSQWFWILFLSFVNTGIGCYLYFSEIAKLPVATVSILGYLEPLSAVIFAVLLLHETLTSFEILGALLILIGAIPTSLDKSDAS